MPAGSSSPIQLRHPSHKFGNCVRYSHTMTKSSCPGHTRLATAGGQGKSHQTPLLTSSACDRLDFASLFQVPILLETYIKQDADNTFVLVDRMSDTSSNLSHRLPGDGQLIEVDPLMSRQFGVKFAPCAQKVNTCSCTLGDSCRFSHLC